MCLEEEFVAIASSFLNSQKGTYGGKGGRPGVLRLRPYKKPFTKTLGKDGIYFCHEATVMHRHAAEQAALFIQNLQNPDVRVDSQLTKDQVQQTEEMKIILRQVLLAVEFLAKQGLAFKRVDRDDNVDFASADVSRGNSIATLQLLGKGKCLTEVPSSCQEKYKVHQ